MDLRQKPLGTVQNALIMRSMAKNPHSIAPEQDALEGATPSPFDRDDPAEAELWFLPGPAEEGSAEVGHDLSPRHMGSRRALPLFDPADWKRAQDALSGELAGLAQHFGALNERLAHLGPELGAGACQRLALREAADLSWWAAGQIGGARIGVERLTLWVGAHLGGGLEDSLALAQAGWAVRRLTAGQGPEAGPHGQPGGGGWQAGIAAFLGYIRDDSLADLADLVEVMDAAHALHPVTQSAMLFHAWRVVGHGTVRGAGTDIEAAVMAAVHAATMAHATERRNGASFMPLALSGLAGLQASGSVQARLAAWIGAAENSCRTALAQLDRLAVWRTTAERDLADQTGRTPAMLVALLTAWPMVSAPMATVQTGASRAAVQRNLDRLTQRGLIREITGQGRYRVWTAKL